jgi:predicted 3-demethylubiquinone-9 3-methyltransferase (glyoxalase superfamily)
MPKISPFLWFHDQAEQAATFYVSLFPRSRIVKVARYGEGGPMPAGTAMTVQLELDGQAITALNGGPHYTLSPAFSFVIDCKDQDEVDHFWNRLIADGGQESQCGWLTDRFGLSWQVVPSVLAELLTDRDPARARRAMEAMMTMRKLDIAALQRAHRG